MPLFSVLSAGTSVILSSTVSPGFVIRLNKRLEGNSSYQVLPTQNKVLQYSQIVCKVYYLSCW